jgi:hypothetical protein
VFTVTTIKLLPTRKSKRISAKMLTKIKLWSMCGNNKTCIAATRADQGNFIVHMETDIN